MKLRLALVLLLSSLSIPGFTQPTEKFIKVIVAPDHPDWTYHTGEKPRFTIQVLRSGNPVKNVSVQYELMPEKMKPLQSATITMADGIKSIDAPTMTKPGFLRCNAKVTIDGKEYSGSGTAGFDPMKIQPVAEDPSDFDNFWNNAKAAAANIPIDAKMTLMPERCTEKVNVYHVSLQNYQQGTRLYGILCVPRKEGKYPALLKVPGAGVRPYFGDVATAEKGVITFEIGIHGIPVNMDPAVYNDLGRGAIDGYPNMNLDDRDHYYYKRVYLGCVRSIDFIFTLPSFDGSTLAVSGGSQGGALSIVTAALDNRVKFLSCFYPALCDLTGYLHGRAGGWPHLFAPNNLAYNNKKDKIATSAYYDVVNFARRVKAPGFYSWGYNDDVCPPTSTFAAYSVITAPKELFIVPETGHWTYPEQLDKSAQWLLQKLKP